MKLAEIKERFAIDISNAHGSIVANWKDDLAQEESNDYLPEGYSYSKVLELKQIEAAEIGQGHGDVLMKSFLASPVLKKAELVFLDISPHLGKFRDLHGFSETQKLDMLVRFYSKYGFVNRKKYSRMWLVLKGTIEKNDLPN